MDLSGEGALTLPVADVAKLASILSAVASRTTAARTTAARTTPAPSPAGRTRTQGAVKSKEADIPISATDPTKMAEAVRMLYGLSWPPPEASEEKQTR